MPSPDRSENHFVPAFGTKYCSDSRKQLLKKNAAKPKSHSVPKTSFNDYS